MLWKLSVISCPVCAALPAEATDLPLPSAADDGDTTEHPRGKDPADLRFDCLYVHHDGSS